MFRALEEEKMRNEILWGLMLICNFVCIIVMYYRFGKIGLFAWVPVATILANIQVVMLVRLFRLEVTLGNILYAGAYLVTDILDRKSTRLNSSHANISYAVFCLKKK